MTKPIIAMVSTFTFFSVPVYAQVVSESDLASRPDGVRALSIVQSKPFSTQLPDTAGGIIFSNSEDLKTPTYTGIEFLDLVSTEATSSLGVLDNELNYYSYKSSDARLNIPELEYSINYGGHNSATLSHKLYAHQGVFGGSQPTNPTSSISLDVSGTKPASGETQTPVVFKNRQTDFGPLTTTGGTNRMPAGVNVRVGLAYEGTVTGHPGEPSRLPFGIIEGEIYAEARHNFDVLERPVIFLDPTNRAPRVDYEIVSLASIDGFSFSGPSFAYIVSSDPSTKAATVNDSLVIEVQNAFDRMKVPVKVTSDRSVYDNAANRVQIKFGEGQCSLFASIPSLGCNETQLGGKYVTGPYATISGETIQTNDQFNRNRLDDVAHVYHLNNQSGELINTITHEALHALGAFHIVSNNPNEVMVNGENLNGRDELEDQIKPQAEGIPVGGIPSDHNPTFHVLAYGVGVSVEELNRRKLVPGSLDLKQDP